MNTIESYTQPELNELCGQAIDLSSFFSPNEFTVLNIERYSFNRMFSKRNQGVLEIQPKDAGRSPSGDIRSPVNAEDEGERPSGNFFLANVSNFEPGKLPVAIYGDSRFTPSMKRMITQCSEIYFADFYCRISDKTKKKIITSHYL